MRKLFVLGFGIAMMSCNTQKPHPLDELVGDYYVVKDTATLSLNEQPKFRVNREDDHFVVYRFNSDHTASPLDNQTVGTTYAFYQDETFTNPRNRKDEECSFRITIGTSTYIKPRKDFRFSKGKIDLIQTRGLDGSGMYLVKKDIDKSITQKSPLNY